MCKGACLTKNVGTVKKAWTYSEGIVYGYPACLII